MKTILIPVDFSAASYNAVRYAAELSKSPEHEIGRIILFNSYYVSIYEQILPSPDLTQVSDQEILRKREEIRQRLEAMKQEVSPLMGQGVTVELVKSDLPLLRAVLQMVEQKAVDLLIIGSNLPAGTRESDIGEQLIPIARTCPVPVLIVPADKHCAGIKKVLLPCDFKNLSNLAPLKSLQDADLWVKSEVLVLNVDPLLRRAEPDKKWQDVESNLQAFLKNINYKTYYSDEKDVLSGILNFAEANKVDLILALPGKHSFFYSMTHKSISQHVAVNSEIPVLILK